MNLENNSKSRSLKKLALFGLIFFGGISFIWVYVVPALSRASLNCSTSPTDFEFLRNNAETDNGRAQFELAWAYIHGRDGTPINYEEALKWLRKSAENGSEHAQMLLGRIYIKNSDRVGPYGRDHEMKIAKEVGFEQNYSESAKWFTKAATQGNMDAQYFLSLQYRDGLGVEQDYEKAYFWMGFVCAPLKKYPPNPEHSWDESRMKFLDDCNSLASKLDEGRKQELDREIESWKKPLPAQSDLNKDINVAGIICGTSKSQQKVVDTCGHLLGITNPAVMDGGYFFANTLTKKIVGSCSIWTGECQPPLDWVCPFPTSNYNG